MIKKLLKGFFIVITVLCLTASTYLTAPREFAPEYEEAWRRLEYNILNSPDSVIYIYWSGRGGLLSRVEDFAQVLRRAQHQGKVIVFILTGPSYSGHAIAACYANKVQFNGNFLMFHPAADDSNNIDNSFWFVNYYKNVMGPCVQQGILTSYDLQRVATMYEVYVYYKNGRYIRYYKIDQRL